MKKRSWREAGSNSEQRSVAACRGHLHLLQSKTKMSPVRYIISLRRWGAIASRGRPSPTPSTGSGSAASWRGPGNLSGRSTCQRIPPNFPGYRPYCPYRLDPALAQKLVRRSPSYGKPVAVFSWFGPTSGRYVVDLLNTLGFRARLVPTKKTVCRLNTTWMSNLEGWAMDYLGASDFILLLRRRSPHRERTERRLAESRAKASTGARSPGRPPTNASPTSR